MPGEDMAMGFVGHMKRLQLLDIINFYCLSTKTVGLTLKGPRGQSGEIRIASGQIVYAATETAQGQNAFFEIAQWDGGQFSERHDLPKAAPNIKGVSSTGLLLEAARIADEARARAAADPELLARDAEPSASAGDAPVADTGAGAPAATAATAPGAVNAVASHPHGSHGRRGTAQALAAVPPAPATASAAQESASAQPTAAPSSAASPHGHARLRQAKAHPLATQAPAKMRVIPAPAPTTAPGRAPAGTEGPGPRTPFRRSGHHAPAGPVAETEPASPPRAAANDHHRTRRAPLDGQPTATAEQTPVEAPIAATAEWWGEDLLPDLLASLDQAGSGSLPLRWFPARRPTDITNRNPSSKLVALVGDAAELAPVLAACASDFESERLDRGELPVVRIGVRLRSALYLTALTRVSPLLDGVPAIAWGSPETVAGRVEDLAAAGAVAVVVVCQDPEACSRQLAQEPHRPAIPVRCLPGRFDSWTRVTLSLRRIFRGLDGLAKES